MRLSQVLSRHGLAIACNAALDVFALDLEGGYGVYGEQEPTNCALNQLWNSAKVNVIVMKAQLSQANGSSPSELLAAAHTFPE
jgi:hypothetical protein